MIGLGIEIPAWLVTAVGVGQCLQQPSTACLALATAGIICLGVSARAARRPAIWPGLALCYLAWSLGLAAAGVTLLEAYTLPAAAVAIFMGWRASRREPRPPSSLPLRPRTAAFARLVHDLPGWLPVAVLGAALLWAGATYEARLRNLNVIRRTLAVMS